MSWLMRKLLNQVLREGEGGGEGQGAAAGGGNPAAGGETTLPGTGTGTESGGGGEDPGAGAGRFTQEQVNDIVSRRLSEENRRYQTRLNEQVEAEIARRAGGSRGADPNAGQPKQPKREDFETYDAFVAATATYEARRAAREERDAIRREEMTAQQRQRQQTLQQKWHEALPAAKTKYPDFDVVVQTSNPPMTQVMQMTIMESDMPHDINYYLAKHPEEAAKIAGLPTPLAQIRALGRLEEKISATPAVDTSNASEPINPVNAGRRANASGGTALNDKLPIKEWSARFSKQFYGRKERQVS